MCRLWTGYSLTEATLTIDRTKYPRQQISFQKSLLPLLSTSWGNLLPEKVWSGFCRQLGFFTGPKLGLQTKWNPITAHNACFSLGPRHTGTPLNYDAH